VGLIGVPDAFFEGIKLKENSIISDFVSIKKRGSVVDRDLASGPF
jgi:hypothetical protein